MIKNIENFNINAIIKYEKVKLPEELVLKINDFWKKAVKETPKLWNGELLCVNEFVEDEKNKKIDIICRKSNYAHYLYNERIGIERKYSCSSLIAGCIFETSDGYYVVGALGKDTSYPGCLQVSGGSADNDDIVGEKIDILSTIVRESKEEININLNDKKLVDSWKIKYIDMPEEELKPHTYIIFAKAKLKMTKNEMDKYYKDYLEFLEKNNLEIEFEKLYFINKNKITEDLNKLDNPKRGYLEKVFLEDANNRR